MYKCKSKVLKVRRVGRDVILYQDTVYYSEIIIRCVDDVSANKVCEKMLCTINEIETLLLEVVL